MATPHADPEPAGATAPPPPVPPAEAATDGAAAEVAAAPRLSKSERRAQAAANALRTFIRDLFIDKFGKAPDQEQVIPLALRMELRAGPNWQLDFHPGLAQQLEAGLEDAEAGFNVFERGRVFDFYAETTRAPACTPPSAISVFAGYNSLGVPQWHDLNQALMDAGDKRTAELYDQPPRVLARVRYGSELKRDQLSTYGRSSKTYAILAQAVAGYFTLPQPLAAGSTDARLAITFQVVETRSPDHRFQLHLNMISHVPWPKLEDYFATGWEPGIQRACRMAEQQLAGLERNVRYLRENGRPEEATDILRGIPETLRTLGVSIERAQRQVQRRTRHVADRRLERPTPNALEDARAALPHQLFFDEKTKAWIACGPHGRSHVFSPEGRHVTSFIMKPKSVEFRVRTRRWRELNQAEAATFKGLLCSQPA